MIDHGIFNTYSDKNKKRERSCKGLSPYILASHLWPWDFSWLWEQNPTTSPFISRPDSPLPKA
jgi:hypothetical protein